MKRFLIAALLFTAAPAFAQTYAVPNGQGGYNYLPANTQQTFSIGSMSFPPPFLSAAKPDALAALGILPAQTTPEPDQTQVNCTGNHYVIAAGTATQTWDCTPLPAAQTAAYAAQAAYNAAIAAGLAVTSTATPSLNGTYSITPAATANITAIMTGVAGGLGLPGSGSTFIYQDASGAPHAFTAAQFGALAVAIRDYIYALSLYAAGQGPLPSTSVAIP